MMESDGLLSKKLLPKAIVSQQRALSMDSAPTRVRPIRELESEAIQKALEIYGTTSQGKKIAARRLGIGIATLYRKLEGLNLS